MTTGDITEPNTATEPPDRDILVLFQAGLGAMSSINRPLVHHVIEQLAVSVMAVSQAHASTCGLTRQVAMQTDPLPDLKLSFSGAYS